MKRLFLLPAAALILGAIIFVPGVEAQQVDDGFCAGVDATEPVHVSLVLDRSASIRDTDPEGTRDDHISKFLKGLLDISRGEVSEQPRTVTVGVVMFAKDSEVILDPVELTSASDVQVVADAIAEGWNDPKGFTDQIKAFDAGYDQLKSNRVGCKVLVMFTDGVIDTGRGQSESDIERATTDACETTRSDGVITTSQRSESEEVTTFVLLLEPQLDSSGQFEGRLSATMTLFESVTGDTTLPELETSYSTVCPVGSAGSPRHSQDGEVLSVDEINKVLASFYKIESDISGGTSAVQSCPTPINNGTDMLPSGHLIRQIVVIAFDARAGLQIDDFEIIHADGATIDASDALEPVPDNVGGPRLRLAVLDGDKTPGGWKLSSKTGGNYCVELFEETEFKAKITGGNDPFEISDPDELTTLTVEYDPDVTGQVEFTFTAGGEEYTTRSSTKDVHLSPDMAAAASPFTVSPFGRYRALNTELFQDLVVAVATDVEVYDYSPESVPDIQCESTQITIGPDEVPEGGQIEGNLGCAISPGTPGTEQTGLVSFVRLEHSLDLTERAELSITLDDGTPLTDEWVPFAQTTDVTVLIENLTNSILESEASFLLEVGYAESADEAEPLDAESVTVVIDMNRRSDKGKAVAITAVVTIIAALLSLLLLWLFNRMTAQLPRARDYFYYESEASRSTTLSRTVSVDADRLGAATGDRNRLMFGSVRIQLVHPSVWRPFSDSQGIIHAPSPAAADPIGPEEGTVPVGFSSLVIGYRDPASENTNFIIVVPRRGQGSGVEGVRNHLNDRQRLLRVEDRLPEIVEETGLDSTVAPDPGPTGLTAPPPADHTRKQDDKDPGEPNLPGGSGPRLPS